MNRSFPGYFFPLFVLILAGLGLPRFLMELAPPAPVDPANALPFEIAFLGLFIRKLSHGKRLRRFNEGGNS